MIMNVRGCRINVILALGQSRAGKVPLGKFKAMTSEVTHKLVPDPLRCFARLVDRFELKDLEEFAASARSEGLLVISSDLVTPDGEVGASALATQLLDGARKAELPLALVGLVSASRNLPAVPPLGLDHLVADGDNVAEQITEAVRQLAPRIWLMLPTPEVAPAREGSEADSEVVIDFPRSLDDFRAILALRFEIYRALGYLSPAILAAKSQLDLDAFDSNAIHLLARDAVSGEIVGCARLIVPDAMLSSDQRQAMNYPADVGTWCKSVADAEDDRVFRDIFKRGTGGNPLPAASMGAYEALRETLKLSHPGLRAEDCCELSRLIVAPKARGQGLSRRLTEAAVQIAMAWLPRTIMIIECREHHRRLYEHFGFQLTGDARAESAGLLRTQAIAMWCDLKKANGQLPHRPNANVVLSSLAQSFDLSDEPAVHLRSVLPAEAWIWSRSPAFTDKSAAGAFDLSLHNHGLACATVQGLTDLLKRCGGKRVSICNKAGDSVDVTAAGSADLPAAAIVLQILKLLH